MDVGQAPGRSRGAVWLEVSRRMQSEDEQRELAFLEQELLDDAALRNSVRHLQNPLWRHRWALAGVGVLLVPAGGVVADGGVSITGLLIAGGVAQFVRGESSASGRT